MERNGGGASPCRHTRHERHGEIGRVDRDRRGLSGSAVHTKNLGFGSHQLDHGPVLQFDAVKEEAGGETLLVKVEEEFEAFSGF